MTQSIFITGAASGIGRATALEFGRRGWFVGLYDIDKAGLEALAKEIGEPKTSRGVLDVTSLDAFRKSVDAFEKEAGHMDVLFNCAGIMRMGRFEEIPPEESAKTIAINLNGVINGIYASLPLLEKSRGCVVNMSSASAIYGTPELAVYSATKFAVRALTEALDIELRDKGVRVCDLMPGYVKTPLVTDQTYHAKTLDTLGVNLVADDIAKLVWKAVHGNRVHWFPKIDLALFIRLAGFQNIARPLMRRYARM